MPTLSHRLNSFKPSRIAEIFRLASHLKEQGEDIADLSTGEPDFQTHPSVCKAAKDAINKGFTKYTPVDGTTELKKAIQDKFRADNQLDYDLSQIIVDAGAKPLLAHTLMAILNRDDEVIIPTPCWPSHPGVVQLCGAFPVFVKGAVEKGFKLKPLDLDHAITEKTTAIILNSPSNPTGAIYTRDELSALTEVLLEHPGIWILADDIYEKLRYDNREFATVAQVEPRLHDRTITINGLSKSHAMTGWRIGYAGGPTPLMSAIRQIMSQATGNPCSISQRAAVAALRGDQSHIHSNLEIYQSRRDKTVKRVNEAQGLTVNPCEGAFYLYVNCQGVLGKSTPGGQLIESSTDFVRYLLEEFKVAVVPGVAFEYDPYFRISFATSDAQLDKACTRMIDACEALN